MDQLNALKPDSLDKVMQVLLFRKMPSYIQDVVNSKDYKTLSDLKQRCYEVWENHSPEAATTANAQRSHSLACSNHRGFSLLRGKRTTHAKSAHCRSPTPAPARGSRVNDRLCFSHPHFRAATRKCDTG
jgi:hypothetical protein